MPQNPNNLLPPDAIAIIGMSGRFPGAGDVRRFWQNLLDCRESITFLAPEDLDPSVAHLASDPGYVRAKGILEGVEYFDASFFGIPPAEARMLDPQQRILLELAWAALEDAGYGSGQRTDKVAVYVGTNWNRYDAFNLASNPQLLQRYGEFNAALANEADFPATRISYKLNLTGPSVSLFTACSTGLVAVSEAVKSLLSYECEMALAGGASVSLPQRQGYLYQEGGMLSKDGHTRTFDASSNGTTFNEGAALVVLKRLEDAVADRDHIYAVIRGAAINNDGGDKMSFTAPSVTGQAEVIAAALGAADVEPESITFVETHGTATPLGDPIEVEALSQVYRRSAEAGAGSCVLGALKSNVGHMTHAAGAAGLIKLALAAERGVIPGTLHFEKANPALRLDQTRFRVAPGTEPWISGTWPRRGAVSSFGVGGTNAHVIVEQPPEIEPSDEITRVPVALLSARHANGCAQLADALADRLEDEPSPNLGDVAYTLATGRTFYRHRLAVVSADRHEMAAGLRAERGKRVVTGDAATALKRLVFAFPGQGAQLPGMGADLYRHDEAFRAAMDDCLRVADANLDIDLRELTVDLKDVEQARALLEQTRYTQPALFAIGYALARHLEGLGLRPDAMVGHSVGEFVAATLAGVMAPADGMRLIIERGRLMQGMPPGGMLAVALTEDEAIAAGEAHRVTVAAINAPDSTVLSGELENIASAERDLTERGIRCTRLRTSHAFHSAMMDPAVEAFGSALADVVLHAPRIPIASTATGAMLTDEQATSPAYWRSHLRVPVRFAGALQTLLAPGRCGIIELGPGATLTSLAQRQSDDGHVFVAALGTRGVVERESVMVALARLWAGGADIPWAEMFGRETRARVSLPTYPFERQRHWIEPASPLSGQSTTALNVQQPLAGPSESADQAAIESPEMSSTQEHYARVLERVVGLFEDVSGIELRGIDPAQSFIALGFDSLFMTQASAAINREFAVPISFRELSTDLDSPESLARHLARLIAPATAPVPDPQQPASAPVGFAASVPADVVPQVQRLNGNTPVEALVAEQLRLMSRQLEILAGGQQPAVAMQAAPAPAASAASSQAVSDQLRIPAPDIDPATQVPGKLPRDPEDDRPVSLTSWDDLDTQRRAALQAFIAEHVAQTSASKKHIAKYRGRHADPRTAAGFSRVWKEIVYPVVCERSSGARLWDLDGNEYIDLLNGFGPNFLGHAHPEVVAAISREIALGFEIGPQQRLAGEAAELICELTGMDRASFMCTGSEAVQAAIRCARTYTQRDKIVLFRGDYHGNFDEVLVRGVTGAGHLKTLPSAPGIPAGSVGNVIVLEYGHESALSIIEDIADQVAAVIVEPVQSRRPELQPRDFLHRVRAITEKKGALLIFDEVVTGFRCHPGGAQAHFGVRADLATYGKVAGGNMPLGIVAGRRAVMDTFDGGTWEYGDDSTPEAGVTFFAGTFVRQPFAIAGCHATLSILKREGPQLQRRVNTMTEGFTSRLGALFANYELPFEIPHFSSVMYLRNRDKSELGSLLWYYLRHYGVFALEGFPTYLTASHTADDIDQLVERFRISIERMISDGMLYSRTACAKATSGADAGAATSLAPPVPGARLGKDPRGNPAWYAPDPERPGAYVQIS
jgi:acyl transferase domain-containing protein